MPPYASGQLMLPRQTLVFTTILGAHVLLAYAFASGMVRQAVEYVAPPIEAEVRRENRDLPPPPPPQDPTVRRVEFDIPLPDNPDYAPEASPDTIYAPPARTAERVEPAPAPPEPILVQGRNQLPGTQEYYPPASIRLGEEGVANVRVCVDEAGRRKGEPTLEQSSGSSRLDRGALDLVKQGRFARSTQGGRPVPNCHRFQVRFELR